MPARQAVMFCLMDVSGSMTEHMKDLAKRFFMLLHLFLEAASTSASTWCSSATPHEAQEVDEETFFHIARDRRHRGVHRARRDAATSRRALSARRLEHLRPPRPRTATTPAPTPDAASSCSATRSCRCQYFAYIEVGERDEDGSSRTSAAMPAICGAPTRESPTSARQLRHAPVSRSRATSSRVPPNCSRKAADAPTERRSKAAESREPLLFDGARMGLRHAQTHLRRDRGDRARRDGARRLPQPDRGDHLRADARRLFLDRHAADVSALAFGKRFARDEMLYRKGYQGLAYEIVINSNPCIAYIMEENTMTMQTLVIAHAASATTISSRTTTCSSSGPTPTASSTIWTSPSATSPNARRRYGLAAVERMLDAAHALMARASTAIAARGQAATWPRSEQRADASGGRTSEETYNDLWRTLPAPAPARKAGRARPRPRSADGAARPARGEPALFPARSTARSCAPGSASWCASCATSRSISTRSGRPR